MRRGRHTGSDLLAIHISDRGWSPLPSAHWRRRVSFLRNETGAGEAELDRTVDWGRSRCARQA